MIGGKYTFVVGFIQSESIGNALERDCGGLQQRCPTRRISGRPASFSKPKPQIKADQEGAAGRSYNYRVVMHTGGAELDMRGRCSAGQKVGRSLEFAGRAWLESCWALGKPSWTCAGAAPRAKGWGGGRWAGMACKRLGSAGLLSPVRTREPQLAAVTRHTSRQLR